MTTPSRDYLFLNDDNVAIGSHLPMDKNLSNTIATGVQINTYVIQVYLGSNISYHRSKYPLVDLQKAKELIDYHCIRFFSHSPTIYNLAGSVKNKSLAWQGCPVTDSIMEKIIHGINQDLRTLSEIGGLGTIIHPGYALSPETREAAMKSIAETLDMVDYPVKGPQVLLEVCAGEKNRIGKDLEELNIIREHCKKKESIGFCLDTAHMFGSGLYDLRTEEGVNQMFIDVDKYQHVKLIHLNDSLVPFNSKKDRHQRIGQGYIWSESLTPLLLLLKKAGQRGIPVVLETTPHDMDIMCSLLAEA